MTGLANPDRASQIGGRSSREEFVTTEGAKAGMLCPLCRVTLTMADRNGIEIDYCPNCRGVWLDRGELDKIIERSVAAMPPVAPAQPAAPAYGQPPHGRRSLSPGLRPSPSRR